jgi:hypothetical protein
MMDFCSRLSISMIPDDMVYELDCDIINLLADSLCGVDSRRAIHLVQWASVHS